MNAIAGAKKTSKIFRVKGIVQGVGFRPFIWRLANELGLSGWVKNDSEGVLIEAIAGNKRLKEFENRILSDAPAAAKVESVSVIKTTVADRALNGFKIIESSTSTKTSTLISADLSICDDCLVELFDENDRRYLYPYINCTNCGPRYSIIEALPYDRPKTSMKEFELCETCAEEYHNPADRRFHAQPLACENCGPAIYLSDGKDIILWHHDAIEAAAKALSDGKILAIKGLGGYHLAVDAANQKAVLELRRRKNREKKAFALMVRDLSCIEAYVEIGDFARAQLTKPQKPIVLLPKSQKELKHIAPDNSELGIMLPYTPVQYLLFKAGAPEILLMTSANISGEPIIFQDEQALEHLTGIADYWLIGNRKIVRRVDDSVIRTVDKDITFLRRARGYAPLPIVKSEYFENKPILAVGAGLKNSISLCHNGYAFVSQHLGDLATLASNDSFKQTISEFCQIYDVDMTELDIASDLHPDYPSSRYAEELGQSSRFQHHKAHIASVMAERNEFSKEIIGFSFDGTGLGDDGEIWGGEIFFGSLLGGFERLGHLAYAPLPGGEAAIKYPAMTAVGFLQEQSDYQRFLPEKALTVAQSLINSKLNSPQHSSIGRLFDALSALLGFHGKTAYEGQAAIRLETLAFKTNSQAAYSLPFDGVWDYAALFSQILKDLNSGLAKEIIAKKFHNGLALAVLEASRKLSKLYKTNSIAISGGVWHNRLLFNTTKELLLNSGFDFYFNKQVPAGDGGISLGQAAMLAAARAQRS